LRRRTITIIAAAMGAYLSTIEKQEKILIMKTQLLIAALVTIGLSGAASAQVAGSTTLGISVTEATRLTYGRSVKKSILGKWVYNEAGDKVGKVEDIIIAPDKNVSYLIIGAGGFLGIDRHDVAIPVAALQEKSGKLILPGATKDIIKSMPRFDYASDTTQRDQFVANANEDLAKAKTKVADLKKKASAATTDAKVKLDKQADGLNNDLKVAEDKLAEMNQAAARRWRDFEGDVNAAMARLRKSIETSSS
jgi:sporulation protein YlmC with PRC-barrel domain